MFIPPREGLPLFRRTKSSTSAPEQQPTGNQDAKPGGKGRPTPTRKEAEAAARERAKLGRDRKAMARQQRELRMQSSRKMREAMRTGDEAHLPARDKGPVRRFARDFVDSRFSFVELMLPLLLVTLVLGWSGNPQLMSTGNAILMGTLLLIVVDMTILRLRLKRQLARRFPGENTRGTTYYAMVRTLQMRFMRLPKAQVKIGQQLPETYR